MMHDVEGYTHEEIARELGITAGGSKSQLFKARAKLRRLLAHVVDGLRPDTDPEQCCTCLLSASPSLPTANPPSRKRSTSPRARSAPPSGVHTNDCCPWHCDERDRVAPPLTQWSTLAAQLREQRHHRDDYAGAPRPSRRASCPSRRPRPHRRAWLVGLRVAAGLVFAAGFGALGRMSAGASPAPSGKEVLGDIGESGLPGST